MVSAYRTLRNFRGKAVTPAAKYAWNERSGPAIVAIGRASLPSVACKQAPQGGFVSSTSEQSALDEVFSLAYEELRRLARAILRGDRSASVSPTTLVNEAWIKLARSPQLADTSPLHFRRIAGRAMRQVLIEGARRRQAAIHGGGVLRITFDESLNTISPIGDVQQLLSLDAALKELSTLSPRQAQLVEGKFFGGLNWAESAAALGISEATVMREWRAARAWLAAEMRRQAKRIR